MRHIVATSTSDTRRLAYAVRLGGATIIPACVCAGLLMTAVPPRQAHAELGACRSDPVVILSSGVVFDLSATINDSASDVQQTTYVLHAPVGTHVLAVVPTDGVVGLTERFSFYADRAANTYATDTVVDTGTSGISVTANTTLISVGQIVLAAASAAGQSNQELAVALST